MGFDTVFKRYEIKYLITKEQKEKLLEAMADHVTLDKYGKTTIRNVYLDTNNYRLIRRSMERPDYKEKIRIRSYSQAANDSTVFVELKKKYDKVVYKRRIPMTKKEAMDWILNELPCSKDTQITREINYFINFYGQMHPSIFLSYDREAYYCKTGEELRITFDENILARRDNIDLGSEVYGEALLQDNTVLMELKCAGGIPLWMARYLSEEKIYKTSFSKYGTAYSKLIFPKIYEKNKETI